MEAITGERGVIAHKTKEYKVTRQDYSEATWIDYAAIDKKCQPWLEYKKHKKDQAHSIANIATVVADLLAMPADTMIAQICKEACMSEADVLFVYA